MTKFAMASGIATLLDIILFRFVFTLYFNVFTSEILAGFCGMITNFILQKRFVFKLNRNAFSAFALSMFSSIVILLIGGGIMLLMVQIPLFAKYLLIPKILVIGMKFFLNYFTKRWIFEGNKEAKD